MILIHSRIAGTGSYLPDKVLTNADLERLVETSDEWIVSRTGIRERHIAADGETTGDLALHAARRALEAAGVAATEIDLIVLGTTTPDLVFPSTACLLQHRLGANGCMAVPAPVELVCAAAALVWAGGQCFPRSALTLLRKLHPQDTAPPPFARAPRISPDGSTAIG